MSSGGRQVEVPFSCSVARPVCRVPRHRATRTHAMEVTTHRVSLKSALKKVRKGKWLRCTLWLSPLYESENSESYERVGGFFSTRGLKAGLVKKDMHDWELIRELLEPVKVSTLPTLALALRILTILLLFFSFSLLMFSFSLYF